ncbi:hypothetical protein ABQE93_20370 [Mycolicibacterium sp. XJ662]
MSRAAASSAAPVRKKVNYWELARAARDVWTAKTWRRRVNYLLQPPGWGETTATTNGPDTHPPVMRHGSTPTSTAMMQKAS